MKKFSIILESADEGNIQDAFEKHIEKIADAIYVRDENLNWKISGIIDDDELDPNLFKIQLMIGQQDETTNFDEHQADTVISNITMINDKMKDLMKNFLVVNSLHVFDHFYRFTYHVNREKFFKDNTVLSIGGIIKYNL